MQMSPRRKAELPWRVGLLLLALPAGATLLSISTSDAHPAHLNRMRTEKHGLTQTRKLSHKDTPARLDPSTRSQAPGDSEVSPTEVHHSSTTLGTANRATHSAPDDNEIALFDDNARMLSKREHTLRNEQLARLLDPAETKRLESELNELPLNINVTSRVVCTQSICDVSWLSGAPIEELITELTPWILTQGNYAVDDTPPAHEGDHAQPTTAELRMLFQRQEARN